MMATIEARNLTKIYGQKPVVNQVNLEIHAGKLTAYLGTNGAGKSTTMRMLTKTLQPSSGKVLYNGEDLFKIHKQQVKISMVFQKGVLDEELTVRENLQIRASMYQDVPRGRIADLIRELKLSSYVDRKYGELSGGMRRKADIARALLNQPEILFLDEPTTGLDVQSRQEIWQLLRRLKEAGVGIFLTTHYLDEADNADYVYIIEQGGLLTQGSAKELKKRFGKNRLWFKQAAAGYDEFDPDKGYGFVIDRYQEVIDLLNKYQPKADEFSYEQAGMDEVFLQVTGRRINDASHS